MQYDPKKTWRENLEQAPELYDRQNTLPPVPGDWKWCGLPIESPLGIPAGPLLDSRWLLYYANCGFDWLVYKTVRSTERECYGLPNLVPVEVGQQSTPGLTLDATEEMRRTWAVSFGMPSQPPDVWRPDVEFAREKLHKSKRLIVSVVGTQDPTIEDAVASREQLADDFALCAKWAAESGADGVEANFSCPNVNTADGQLHQNPINAAIVAKRIRAAIGDKPLVLKIGHVADQAAATRLVENVGPYVNGLAMTNSISARVRQDNMLLFDGNQRGICGHAIRDASIQQVAMFRDVVEKHNIELDLIGVGGIFGADDVKSYLAAGASSVGIATAAMLDPAVAMKIRKSL